MIRRGVARRSARRTTRRVVRRRAVLRSGLRFRRRRFLIGGMTMLIVGGAAYKMGQAEAQKIQQHTGKPPEDLTQPELEKAMDDLGIQEQEVTPADMKAIEAEAEGGSPAAGPGPSSAAASGDYLAEIEKLAALRDKGIITDAEFEAKKKQLLGL